MTGNPNSELWRVAGVRARQGPVWNFSVAAGAAAWIPDSDDDGLDWLDWLLGLTTPPEGAVHWQGRDWQAYSPDAASAARGTIGCVLTTGGALANLDMDENVWLPARIHRRTGAAAEIETWARRFRCWPLPARRPAVVRERERSACSGRARSPAGRWRWCWSAPCATCRKRIAACFWRRWPMSGPRVAR